jgi:hypothetical protein
MLSRDSFETVVPSLLGPDKVSDPKNSEIEYGCDLEHKYPTDYPSVFGSFMGSLGTARRLGPTKSRMSSGRTSSRMIFPRPELSLMATMPML